ncbi:MAG TPA: glycoside hydrolase family 16 protein [Patescibacteria group bacterium]|nr:glycoside hydrolase family 16 protein [Patescibacteria group bacterium]
MSLIKCEHLRAYYLLALLALATGMCFLHGAARNKHLPAAPAGYRWKISMDEEFNGNALDTSRWTTCYDWYDKTYQGCTNPGNDEQEWYNQKQVKVQDGKLTLTAESKPILGWNKTYEQTFPYTSGMISSGRPTPDGKPRWTATCGYYEARMRSSAGKGIWPAFWLLPADRSWPPEIDIMEGLGDKPAQPLMTYHWVNDNQQPQKDTTIYPGTNKPDSTAFSIAAWHTYAINWQPKRIDWYIDGRLVKTFSGAQATSKPMELILNLAVGGTLPGYPDNSTVFPATTEVDYIRVYTLNKK